MIFLGLSNFSKHLKCICTKLEISIIVKNNKNGFLIDLNSKVLKTLRKLRTNPLEIQTAAIKTVSRNFK